ncbi:carbohydrate ABC transporter permease [Bombiscardovia coagulans]|uniref:Sugar ABC transporter permease n=1 Tax=Bombiscardovia coagulans TaxID=686666 RepID=A0A261ETP8_9BIFI|nr:carbohydrate ABC transporter permease [Bombiscardovia coagulans]OZG50244.1 sugar ABC transporter permease [Bombiscardovia coagulans]
MVRRSKLSQGLMVLLGIILTAIVLLPVLYIFIGALTFNASGNVSRPTFSNFTSAARSMPLVRQVCNSIVVTVCQTAGQIITAILAAYAIVFCNFKRPQLWMMVFLLSLMIPGETTILSNYLSVTSWGLIDTLPAIFLPYLVQGFTVFLFRQAFRSFPSELRDAASIDGAGHFRFMFHVLLPITQSTVLAATINSAVSAWNGYFWPLLVTNSPESRTIQVGITQLSGAESSHMGVVLAGSAIAILPTLILTLCFNKSLRGMTVAGGLK